MILCNFRSLFYFTYISVNSWYLNKPDEDWYCPVEVSQLKSISRCLISPCKSLLDCNVFNLIYFDWLRSFWIWRWASLIVHGFCIVVVVVVVVFFFLYLNSALFNRVYHIATTFYFVCSKKRPGHPSNPPYLIFRPNWKFLEPEPPPLGSGRPHPPLIWRSGSITAHILSMNAVTVWASGIWLRTRKVKICFHFKSDTSYFHTQVNIRKERWWNSRNCNVSTVFTYVKDKLPVCRTKLCFLDCNVFKFCECLQSG